MSNENLQINNARIPVIALPYSEKDKAEKKELLVDYEKGKLYVVSATDKSIIFDITANILNSFTDIQASDMMVNIEGIGLISLQEILNIFNDKILDNELSIEPTNVPVTTDVGSSYDNVSITNKDTIVQMYEFDNAPEGTIPKKQNGRIHWINPKDFNVDSDSDGYSNIIHEINPIGSTINFSIARYQRTTNPDPLNYHIAYPINVDTRYIKFDWLLVTGEDAPSFTFPSNTIFEWASTSKIYTNSFHVFSFETWDGGDNWLVSSKAFQLVNSSYQENTVRADDITDTDQLLNDISSFLFMNIDTIGTDDAIIYNNLAYSKYLLVPSDLSFLPVGETLDFDNQTVSGYTDLSIGNFRMLGSVAIKKGDSTINGVSHTQYLDLQGSGSRTNRCVTFTTSGPGNIVVAASSTSATTRTLIFGNTTATLGNLVTTSTTPVIQSFIIPSAGTYYLYSSGSAIRIYEIKASMYLIDPISGEIGIIDVDDEDLNFPVKYGVKFDVPISGSVSVVAKAVQNTALIFVGRNKSEAYDVYKNDRDTYKEKYILNSTEKEYEFNIVNPGTYYLFANNDIKLYSITLKTVLGEDDIITLENLKENTYTKDEINDLVSWKDE